MTDGRRADGLTVELVRAGLADNEALLTQFDRVSVRIEVSDSRQEDEKPPESADETDEKRSGTRMPATAPSSKSKVLKVPPLLLHRAAEAYLGIAGHSKGGTPRQRLADYIRGSPESVDVLLTAMEGTVERTDLPDCDEVVQLFDKQEINLLVLPLVAGLHSLEKSGRLSVGDLKEDQIRLAVTNFLHASPKGGRSGQCGRIRHISAGLVSGPAAGESSTGVRCPVPNCGAEAHDGVTAANGAT